MAIKCKIEFENSSDVAYSGKVLRGKVHLGLTESTKVRSIYIRFEGKEYVRWTVGYGDNEMEYTAENRCLDQQVCFVLAENGVIELIPGSYIYPFQYSLPTDLPTSFESDCGYVRYKACAVVCFENETDQQNEIQFTVVNALDLNDPKKPFLREPLILKNDNDARSFIWDLFCWFEPEDVEITAHIPVQGYTSGQTIKLTLTTTKYNCQSSQFIVQLIKEINHKTSVNSWSESQSKDSSYVLVEKSVDCQKLKMEGKTTINLSIPSVPATAKSNLTEIQYYIQISGEVGCFRGFKPIRLPITIGTIPISGYNLRLSSKNFISHQPSAANISLFDSGDLSKPSYPIASVLCDGPPTYEETMHSEDNKGFSAPKYAAFSTITS